MRLLFVADGRSPIAVQWMRFFAERGDEVFLASTTACEPDFSVSGKETIPVAFTGLGSMKNADVSRLSSSSSLWLRGLSQRWVIPLTLGGVGRQLKVIETRIQPDVVHALRIPFEGMIAGLAGLRAPLVVSVWGNDFTLHAPASPLLGYLTRNAMKSAIALHADCHRDVRLARDWGFESDRPTLVVPSSGGIRSSIFSPAKSPATKPIVLNPRGVRPYVRNDTFFRAIPIVLRERPDAQFICTGMKGISQIQDWVRELKIGGSVTLLESVSHSEMADLFRSAQLAVSPSVHDGTPNSLLEAMACGCFPVAGDLESIREWIEPGVNGLIVDSRDPVSVAAAIVRGLNDSGLRESAANYNRTLIAEHAEYNRCMNRVSDFYRSAARTRGSVRA